MHDEAVVDHLAMVFWEHHRPEMLKACDNVVSALEGEAQQDEKLREAIKVGIRAVLDEIKSAPAIQAVYQLPCPPRAA